MGRRRAAADVFKEQNAVQMKVARSAPAAPAPPAQAYQPEQPDFMLADQLDAVPPPRMAAPEPQQFGQASEPADDLFELQLGPQAQRAPVARGGFHMPKPSLNAPFPVRQEKKANAPMLTTSFKTSEEMQLEKEPIRVRETGFWFWRRIIVPPNAYVVQTRMGRKDPVTIGLGISFRYNPYTDAYLVVPAAMQTIGIVANCITKEKQGINLLAYVQWQIADFSIAYRKLDFSDSRDPLGIVNAQLREQAEAAIKDKIATMSVEEVLTDKEPIIEELTTRLKTVAEGRAQNSQNGTNSASAEGLGIKIVTVQIKEAFVSSQTLWENLQAPFRNEKEKSARISFLLAQDEIRKKELETRQIAETSEAETLVAIERIKQTKQTEAFQVKTTEEATRFLAEQEEARRHIQLEEQTTLTRRESEQKLQQQSALAQQEMKLAALRRAQEEAIEHSRLETEASARQKALKVEQALREITEETRLATAKLSADQEQIARDTTRRRLEAELTLQIQAQKDQLATTQQEAELARLRREKMLELELEEAANRAAITLAEQQANVARIEQEIRNSISSGDISSRLVDKLPELAMNMPEVHELKVLQTGGADGGFDSLTAFLARVMAIAESLGVRLNANVTNGTHGANPPRSAGEVKDSND